MQPLKGVLMVSAICVMSPEINLKKKLFPLLRLKTRATEVQLQKICSNSEVLSDLISLFDEKSQYLLYIVNLSADL